MRNVGLLKYLRGRYYKIEKNYDYNLDSILAVAYETALQFCFAS